MKGFIPSVGECHCVELSMGVWVWENLPRSRRGRTKGGKGWKPCFLENYFVCIHCPCEEGLGWELVTKGG